MVLTKKLTPVAMATTLALSGLGVSTAANAAMTGNIGVHSKYLLRGISEENADTAVQGGLDYSQDSGFYLGYWFSNLSYNYSNGVTQPDKQGFENDLYGGYAGNIGGFGFDVGLTQYVYINVDDSDLTELNLKGTFGGFYVKTQTLLTEGWWGNNGDTYLTAGYSFGLPSDFSLAFDAGTYFYNDSDNSKLGGVSPSTPQVTQQTSAFRNFNITLSHPVGTTGANMYIEYVVAGEDRTGFQYDDSMLAGVTYSFDITKKDE